MRKAHKTTLLLATVATVTFALLSHSADAVSRVDNQHKDSVSTAPERWQSQSYAIASDDDQRRNDSEHNSIPGISAVPARVFGMHSALRTSTTSSTNLFDHGGPVLASVIIHPIWWGDFSQYSDYQAGINRFLSGLTCSGATCTGLSSVVSQYLRKSVQSVSLGSSYTDASTPVSSAPSTSQIVAEAGKVLSGSAPDANGLYMVFTNNFPSRVSYCAWHSAGTVNNKWLAVAYMPNLWGVSGCSVTGLSGYSTTANTSNNVYSAGAQSAANVSSHEIYEAISDSMLNGVNAWYDSYGSEIGDKCAWTHAATETLTDGMKWYLQNEWSNTARGCAA
jgi:hypothetical protein